MLHNTGRLSGIRTRTERVICLLELFTWGVVLAFCSYTFEVIGVILEAGTNNEQV